jgi:DNA-binding transcriptional MerR regulator
MSVRTITVFTVTVISGIVEPVEMSVDELARRSGLPVRTIREYQTLGLLPPPERRGRVGVYRDGHLARLALIGRLQRRGYSLAGIRDLLRSWSDGGDLGEVLGLAPDELIHLDEPGTPATIDQLERLLPRLVPQRLSDLLAAGVVEACGPDRYCVPSPSLLQLVVDLLAVGYGPDEVLAFLDRIAGAAGAAADAAVDLFTPPPAADPEQLVHLAHRGRGLLAHAVGRLTIHTIGRRLGIAHEDDVGTTFRRLLGAEAR